MREVRGQVRREPVVSKRVWGLSFLFVASLGFVLFQGGKLSMTVFMTVAVLCAYLLLGRWSGIKRVTGGRRLMNASASGSGREAGGSGELVLEAGQSMQVQVDIKVPGIWPIPYVLVRDRIVRKGGKEMSFEMSVILDWKRQGSAAYRTPPLKRGVYTLEELDCSTEDIFGLFEHKGTLRDARRFSVLPKTTSISDWPQLNRAYRGTHHQSATAQSVRETTQINGVREYIYGDRLSRVHWNATAKTGTWKSKEFEREALPRTILVLDRQAAAYRGDEPFELAVSVTASLLQFASRRDLAIGLLSAGSSPLYFEPRKLAGVSGAIWEHLTGVEADGKHPLPGLLREWCKSWPQGSLVAVVGPIGSESAYEALRWLKERQFNPHHIGIDQNRDGAQTESWRRLMRSEGIPHYVLSELDELSAALGGRAR